MLCSGHQSLQPAPLIRGQLCRHKLPAKATCRWPWRPPEGTVRTSKWGSVFHRWMSKESTGNAEHLHPARTQTTTQVTHRAQMALYKEKGVCAGDFCTLLLVTVLYNCLSFAPLTKKQNIWAHRSPPPSLRRIAEDCLNPSSSLWLPLLLKREHHIIISPEADQGKVCYK